MHQPSVPFVSVACLAALLSACSSQPTKQIFADTLSAETHGIAVAAVELPPNVEVKVPTRSKAEGLGEGAGSGGLAGAAIGMEVAVMAGPVGLLLAPYLIGTGAVIGTVGGGVYGVAASESAKTVASAEASIHAATSSVPLQQRLQKKVGEYIAGQTRRPAHLLPPVRVEDPAASVSYRDPGLPDIDTILELRITDIHSTGGRLGRPVSIVLRSEARLFRAASGELLGQYTYQYTSLARKLPEWAANDAEAVYLAYERALHGIANEIVHENFLLYAVPPSLIPEEPGPQPDTEQPATTHEETDWDGSKTLAAVSPAWQPKWDGGYQLELLAPFQEHRIRPVRLKTRTPDFRWKPFPQPRDRPRDPQGVIAGINTVVYDLEIYNVSDEVPREVVDFRYGLSEPHYQPASALEACTTYAWSVRARFNQGPYLRATDWTINNVFGQSARRLRNYYRHPEEVARDKGESLYNPMKQFHRFKTPCQQQPPAGID
jgi:hypothetical protein